MGTQFQGDAIIISPQIRAGQQEFTEPISKKPKISEASPLNYPHNSNSLKRPPNCLFFKTRLCLKFRSGSCTNGRNCNFAHGSKELRRPPPNWKDLITKDGGVRDEQMLQKNEIYKMFYRGEVCSYGERGAFMHLEHGMSGVNMMSKGSASVLELGDNDSESIVVVGSGNGNNQKTFWKTKMCNKWEAMGHCPFGEKCYFAHGHAELAEFRSHMELDRANVAAALVKPDLQLIKNVSVRATMSSINHHTRGFLKWEDLQKKRHIYADWIDDIPLHICSSISIART